MWRQPAQHALLQHGVSLAKRMAAWQQPA